MQAPTQKQVLQGSASEVFRAFLKLGVSSFGGPIAHLGYFRDELVIRRGWIDEKSYADLIALCQFLPGPASSQVGFALGLHRAGTLGALAAWTAFTLPSAILLFAFALGASCLDNPAGQGVVAGLKTVAVAIVAQAVWGMARTLAPDRTRASIALAAAVAVALIAGSVGQIAAILVGAAAGLVFCRGGRDVGAEPLAFPISKRSGAAALAVFAVLLVGLPAASALTGAQAAGVVETFYRAGALVFGGGHVVLPLLETGVVRPGWVEPDTFLAGYGAAQAVPGPLFTFAAYLGAALKPEPNGLEGAAIALVSIFLPGFLLLVGTIPFWNALRARPSAQAAMRGTNAAVVGILAAALYDPVFTGGVTDGLHFALAAVSFVLLTVWHTPPWIVVLLSAAVGLALGLL